MDSQTSGDYVLGTHDEELRRLGVQHRAWAPVVVECWKNAGIAKGSRVLDVGAGPGYATTDLAEIVGDTGRVVAVERSPNFVSAIRQTIEQNNLANVEVHELDLMQNELPSGPFDFSWCRWVLCFVSEPELLVRKLATALRKNGRAIFHEYGHYTTWRFIPQRASIEEFRAHVVATWRESGGEPDVGRQLPAWLSRNGFIVRSIVPRIFCLRPDDYMWQWPAEFIHVYLDRLRELGKIDNALATRVRDDLAAAAKERPSFILTPLVLEIVAEKI
ncbi:MAG TPA: methyltransferase domain-containing protein [Chthoniobacterales bacterium]|nr:methyltransferase domain-containing protein [Chthoniobacterales bacterium]